MKIVIITADDYGLCQAVDTAIDRCISAGVVTSTNVMMNMETTRNAALLRTKFPMISIGIHWNVTTGKPLLDAERIPSLVDANGDFFSIQEFKRRMKNGEIKRDHLVSELKAQFVLFRDMCGLPDYWNTHENSALSLRTFGVFSELAQHYRIPATRSFRRVYIDIGTVPIKRRLREFGKKLVADVWFGVLLKKKYVMPDARLFPFRVESKYNTELLMKTLLSSKFRAIEIVAHPSIEGDNEFFGGLSKERLEEYSFFSSECLRKRLEHCGLIIGNFADL